VPGAVRAAQAGSPRGAGERPPAPRPAVRENRCPRVARRVPRAKRPRPPRIGHRVAVTPVEVAVSGPRRQRVQPSADVASKVRPVLRAERGNVDAADIARRGLEECGGRRSGRTDGEEERDACGCDSASHRTDPTRRARDRRRRSRCSQPPVRGISSGPNSEASPAFLYSNLIQASEIYGRAVGLRRRWSLRQDDKRAAAGRYGT
jgi:hypothetical protein